MATQKKKNSSDTAEHFYTDEHTIPLDELEVRLRTNFAVGLSAAEAALRLQQNGPNELTARRRRPKWVKFLVTMFSGFAGLLWVAGVLCFVAYGIDVGGAAADGGGQVAPDNLYMGATLLGVVVFSGIFAFYQEDKSDRIMEGFERMVPPRAWVLRGGRLRSVEARDLVQGDVVDVAAGGKVPADLRMLEASCLKVGGQVAEEFIKRGKNCRDK